MRAPNAVVGVGVGGADKEAVRPLLGVIGSDARLTPGPASKMLDSCCRLLPWCGLSSTSFSALRPPLGKIVPTVLHEVADVALEEVWEPLC